jgi:hypothetical protein
MSGEVIPFPGSQTVKAEALAEHDEVEETADAEALADYLDEPPTSHDEEFFPDDTPAEEPSLFIEADGEWVWLPREEDPTHEVPVGMVSFAIRTQCRWMHRHHADGLDTPQRCCYSVLVTTARLPGPVRTGRHWLAEVDTCSPPTTA